MLLVGGPQAFVILKHLLENAKSFQTNFKQLKIDPFYLSFEIYTEAK